MKKYIAIIALIVAYQAASAQSTKTLFKEFGQEEHAEFVSLSPLLMGVARLFMDDDESDCIARKITSMKVLDLDDCSEQVKRRFHKKVSRLNLKGYETLVRANSDGEKVQVLMKMKDDAVRELLIVCTGDDCALIQFNGRIDKEEIAALVDEETGKRRHERN